MYIYKIRIDTKVSGLHKYVIFCHFQNRQKIIFCFFLKYFCQYKKFIYICTRNQVRSARALSSVGSEHLVYTQRVGVRIPQRPQKEVKKGLASFFMS